MQTFNPRSLFILCAILVLSSCTMEKRMHRSGFHVDWRGAGKELPADYLSREKLAKADQDLLAEKASNQDTLIQSQLSLPSEEGVSLQKEIPSADRSGNAVRFSRQAISVLSLNPVEVAAAVSRIKLEAAESRATMRTFDPPEEEGYSVFAIIGLVCGLLGLMLLALTGFPFLMGTLAVIFSSVGIVQTGKGKKGKGFAIAGLIVGILTLLIFWIFLAIILFLLMMI